MHAGVQRVPGHRHTHLGAESLEGMTVDELLSSSGRSPRDKVNRICASTRPTAAKVTLPDLRIACNGGYQICSRGVPRR